MTAPTAPHRPLTAAHVTDLRRWLYAGYAVALALGIGLITSVSVLGSQMLAHTRTLVQRELPALQRLYDARTAVQEYQTALFEYYASGDSRRFEALSAVCDARIRTAVDRLPRDQTGDDLAATLGDGHARLFTLGGQLTTLIRDHPGSALGDPERARRMLSAATTIAQGLHTALEAALTPVQAQADARGEAAQAVLDRLVGWTAALAAAILLMSLAIGYFANAYLRERVERHRLATFPERNPNPVLSLDCDGGVVYANDGARRWLDAQGLPATDVAALLPDDLRERLDTVRDAPAGSDYWEYERPIGNSARTLGCGIHYLADFCEFHLFVSDITERKRAECLLRHQALHDALTGLPNRRSFEQAISQRIGTDAASPFTVLFVSVDRFSTVVQGLGHTLADQVLNALAGRLQLVAGEPPLRGRAYRFEGTRFAVILPTAGDARVAAAAALASRLAAPIAHGGRDHYVSYTLGGTSYPADGEDLTTLLKNADSALQIATRRGSGQLAWYQPAMNDRATQRLTLENDLRHAIDRGELSLHYQPQVDLASGDLVGAEALLRWQPANGTPVSPAEFIPIAEESGLIVPIGEWVLREACRRHQAWRAAGHRDLIVAVNVSAQQFQRPGFAGLVRQVLADTGLPAHGLELEVTESVAMDDVEATIETLAELKAIGVHLSIDDFGTGYSSLSYLKRFPIDKLKVDQSFVRHMATETDAAAIARAVIDLGHNLRLRVIAEGVETIEQLGTLRRFGCDEMQGYFYSRPLPAAAFAALLAAAPRLPSAAPDERVEIAA